MKTQATADRPAHGRLASTIREANAAGRLGLVLYVVPGFPSLDVYRDVVAFLDERPSVTTLETTLPVATGHETANEVIVRAHVKALENLRGQPLKPLLVGSTPRFAVLYRKSLENVSYEEFLAEYGDCFDGVIPEWRATETEAYVETSRAHGVEFMQGVAPSMTMEQAESNARLADPSGLVYLGCSTKTGGEMAPVEELSRCARRTKELRPDVSICAGMGVKTSDDVRRIGRIDGVDAVVMGTAFLQAMGDGLDAARRLVMDVEHALVR